MQRLFLAVVAAGCLLGPAYAEPVTVRDAFGRAVTLPAPPQRIVTIFASNTEMVAALGLTDRIVGIEAYTRFPPEVLGKPLVGGRLGFSVDAVVAERPDLVVVTPARQAANQLVDPMERLGIPIVVLLHRSVAEVLDNIRLLGRLGGVAQRGEELAVRLQARLDRVKQRILGLDAPSTVMITGRLGNGLLLVAGRAPIPATPLSGPAAVSASRAAAPSPRSRPRRSSTPTPMCFSLPAVKRISRS